MVQVVKWYVCSFHAGRKSGVAKKPYNPVLGEVFRCFWELPSTAAADKDKDKDKDGTQQQQAGANKPTEGGPVPWCNENQLAFVAEQVSHHPPGMCIYIYVCLLVCVFERARV